MPRSSTNVDLLTVMSISSIYIVYSCDVRAFFVSNLIVKICNYAYFADKQISLWGYVGVFVHLSYSAWCLM